LSQHPFPPQYAEDLVVDALVAEGDLLAQRAFVSEAALFEDSARAAIVREHPGLHPRETKLFERISQDLGDGL
jgi:hypothetical protein